MMTVEVYKSSEANNKLFTRRNKGKCHREHEKWEHTYHQVSAN